VYGNLIYYAITIVLYIEQKVGIVHNNRFFYINLTSNVQVDFDITLDHNNNHSSLLLKNERDEETCIIIPMLFIHKRKKGIIYIRIFIHEIP
jgi:hypothetical protein